MKTAVKPSATNKTTIPPLAKKPAAPASIPKERMSHSEIKKLVGNSWVLVYNPTYKKDDPSLVESGEVGYFDKSRDNVEAFILKEKTTGKHFTVRYFGKIPNEKMMLNFL